MFEMTHAKVNFLNVFILHGYILYTNSYFHPSFMLFCFVLFFAFRLKYSSNSIPNKSHTCSHVSLPGEPRIYRPFLIYAFKKSTVF